MVLVARMDNHTITLRIKVGMVHLGVMEVEMDVIKKQEILETVEMMEAKV